MTVSQNFQEAQLVIEQLTSQVQSHGFRRELGRSEELLKNMTLDDPEKEALAAQIEGLKTQQESWKAENSQVLKQEFETALAEIEKSIVVPEQTISEIWDSARQQLEGARKQLESLQEKLKAEGRNLTKADQDACWQRYKDLRKTQKKNRNNLSSALISEAEGYLSEAEAIVKNEDSLKLAREQFQVKQKQVNQMPLWREQRQRFHQRFNALWTELQARSKSLREDRQQRQEEGLQKLEEALEYTKKLVARKEEDNKVNEDRYNQARWHEVDPIEKHLQRSRKELDQALRKQRELEYKLADARKRMAPAKVATPDEAPIVEGAETTKAVPVAETAAVVSAPPKAEPAAKLSTIDLMPDPAPSEAQLALARLKEQLESQSAETESAALAAKQA